MRLNVTSPRRESNPRRPARNQNHFGTEARALGPIRTGDPRTGILIPLNYESMNELAGQGSNLESSGSEPDMFPVTPPANANHHPFRDNSVRGPGFEPGLCRVKAGHVAVTPPATRPKGLEPPSSDYGLPGRSRRRYGRIPPLDGSQLGHRPRRAQTPPNGFEPPCVRYRSNWFEARADTTACNMGAR